ncbi:MAG: tetratricopeptide repeat protein [Desulfobacteraceae bacterium]|nr:tetratricopeptide repeat protein [Desulfobacteraceae bacterium]MBC2757487.1 tetratricopeptide repeat protein [Desulfobacteraceae bacterium]
MTGVFILFLMVAGTLVYSNTFQTSFVFDDINFITKNDPNVHMTEFSWGALKKAAVEGEPRHRYLPNISFAVNYYFGAENTFGYHLVNIGIHLMTGIFLFFLFQATLRLCSRQDGVCFSGNRSLPSVSPETLSFFAVLIWLVHPVQTNAVTYICQRMASMVAMFYILSLLCYVIGRINFRKGRTQTAVFLFFGCIISGCCAIASKQNAGILPVFILFYEWFFFQDLKTFRSYRTLLWIIIGLIVFVVVAIHFLGVDPLHRILSAYTRREFTLPQRVMTEFRVVVYYLSLLFCPQSSRLILDHNYPLSYAVSDPFSTLTCFVSIIAIGGLAAYLAKKDRLISFALFWFLGNLLIESSVIGIEIIYEHRMYLPTMFLYLMITVMVFRMFKARWAAAGVLILCMMILSVWAHQRNRIWESDVTFWTDSVKKSPQKERPYQNLAYSLQIREEFEDALFYYRKSLAIKPHPVVYFNMGLCLERIGYHSDAVDAYVNALQMKYNTPQVQGNLAKALANIGEFNAAVSYFENASKMNPSDPSFKKNALVLKDFLNHCRTPERCLRMSIAQKPDNPALRFKLGMIYEKQGKPEQAYNVYEKILNEIGASDRKLYLLVLNRMVILHTVKGEMDQSLHLLQKGIEVAPDNPHFYYEIAVFYGAVGEVKHSVAWLDMAIKKGYQNLEQIKSDRRLESIRNTQYFQNLIKRK